MVLPVLSRHNRWPCNRGPIQAESIIKLFEIFQNPKKYWDFYQVFPENDLPEML